jgi:hypothetical protein
MQSIGDFEGLYKNYNHPYNQGKQKLVVTEMLPKTLQLFTINK